MSRIYRLNKTANMALITRQGKGTRLTIQEMDDNLLYLQGKSGGVHTLTKPPVGLE